MRSICVAIIALFVLLIPSAVCFAAESDENSGNASILYRARTLGRRYIFGTRGIRRLRRAIPKTTPRIPIRRILDRI